MSNILEVSCPTCSKAVKWIESSTYRPFCSQRCKLIDLGAWADESYSIPFTTQDEWSLQESFSERDLHPHHSAKDTQH